MVIRQVAIAVLVMLALCGCYDRYPGPGLQNALNSSVELSVIYTDGKRMDRTWPSGRFLLIGRHDLLDSGIQEVVVRESGNVIHRLSRNDVRCLIERQRNYRKHTIWCVERESIYLFEPDPPDTGGCSKGRRL